MGPISEAMEWEVCLARSSRRVPPRGPDLQDQKQVWGQELIVQARKYKAIGQAEAGDLWAGMVGGGKFKGQARVTANA